MLFVAEAIAIPVTRRAISAVPYFLSAPNADHMRAKNRRPPVIDDRSTVEIWTFHRVLHRTLVASPMGSIVSRRLTFPPVHPPGPPRFPAAIATVSSSKEICKHQDVRSKKSSADAADEISLR
jgi:hypothetical protein